MYMGCSQQGHRQTVGEAEADLGIPKTTVSKILTQDLGIKIRSWLLLPEQKEHCAAIANNLIQTTTNEPDLLKNIINGDESLVHGYDSDTKGPVVPIAVAWFSTPEEGAAKSRPC